MSHYNSNNKQVCTNKQRAAIAGLWTSNHPKLKKLNDRLEFIGYASGLRGKEVAKTT